MQSTYKSTNNFMIQITKSCDDILYLTVINLYIRTYILQNVTCNNLRSDKNRIKKIPFIFVTEYIYMFVKKNVYIYIYITQTDF